MHNREKKKGERDSPSFFSNSNSKLGGDPREGYPVIFDRLVKIIFFFQPWTGSGSPLLLVFVERMRVFRSAARRPKRSPHGL